MIVSERLRLELRLPADLRAQMMLGALAPDAHTETEAYDRTWLHPEPGADVVGYVTAKLRPPETLDAPEGRAFALSVVAHIVGDEMFRHGPPGLPDHAPLGLVPCDQGTLDLPGIREDLAHAAPRFGLDPLSAEDILAKRADALSRPPLADATEPHLMVPELAEAVRDIVARTLALAEGTPLLHVE